MAANKPLVWTKTGTNYWASTSYGHYEVARRQAKEGGKPYFVLLVDGQEDGGKTILREAKARAQFTDNARHESAEKEAAERDVREAYTERADILKEATRHAEVVGEPGMPGPVVVLREEPIILRDKAGEVQIVDTDRECYECGAELSPEEVKLEIRYCEECDDPANRPDTNEAEAMEWWRNEGQQEEARRMEAGGEEATKPNVGDLEDNTDENEPHAYQIVAERFKEAGELSERVRKGKDGVEPTIPPYDDSLQGATSDGGDDIDGILAMTKDDVTTLVFPEKEGDRLLREERANKVGNVEGDIVREYSISVIEGPMIDPQLEYMEPQVGDIVRYRVQMGDPIILSDECRIEAVGSMQWKYRLSKVSNGDRLPGEVPYSKIHIMRRPARVVDGVSHGPWTSSR